MPEGMSFARFSVRADNARSCGHRIDDIEHIGFQYGFGAIQSFAVDSY